MALSNIWREPRREITETLVGLAIVVPLLWLDYKLAVYGADPTDKSMPVHVQIIILMVVLPIVAALGIGILVLIFDGTHKLGEWICDLLDDNGITLRPKQRY